MHLRGCGAAGAYLSSASAAAAFSSLQFSSLQFDRCRLFELCIRSACGNCAASLLRPFGAQDPQCGAVGRRRRLEHRAALLRTHEYCFLLALMRPVLETLATGSLHVGSAVRTARGL